MPRASSSKRKSTGDNESRPQKRAREEQVLDEEEDVAALWAQILEQEANNSVPVEDDLELALRLQREYENEVSEAASNSFSSRPPNNHADPKLSFLPHKSLFSGTRTCTKCQANVSSPRGYVIFSSGSPPPSLLFLLHAPCKSCKTNHCRGCWRPLTCKPTCKGKTCDVASCCAGVRAVALFEALGALDRNHLAGSTTTSQTKASDDGSIHGSPEARSRTTGQGGTGYGMDSSSLYYYRNAAKPKHEPEHSSRWDEAADTAVIRALQTLHELLPNPNSDNIFDMLPHPSIQFLLRLSFLPEILADLLRNGSVTEWTKRSEVYHAMLQLLKRLADSELSVGLLIEPGLEKKSSPGIEEWMWTGTEIIWEIKPVKKGPAKHPLVDPELVNTPPLYDHFQKLVRQCEAFLKMMSRGATAGDADEVDEDGEESMQATTLCLDMIAPKEDLSRVIDTWTRRNPSLDTGGGVTTRGKGKAKAENPEAAYNRVCEKLAFEHTCLFSDSPTGGLDYATHLFGMNLKQTETSTRNPKSRLHLVKELAVMATSLPPGVWLRVDEVRNDAIKIMIAGPEGTPYEGGLFEFDCFLPLEYPNVCPLVYLRTTAGGRVRFNPNLYANGKVCLSLLGTWAGRPEEQWLPGRSTLLQVLVSIQSMILVDAPMYNEPGYGQAVLTDPRSISYNKNVALQNVRWAMLDWMRDEFRDGIWGGVIASHFLLRQGSIRKRIVAWGAEDRRIGAYDPSSTSTCGHHGEPYSTGPIMPGTLDLLADFDARIRKLKT